VKRVKFIFIIFSLLVVQSYAYAQNPSDYLILQSIGNYNNDAKGKCRKGTGVLGGSGHFDLDHDDATCNTDYYNFHQKNGC